MLTIQEGQCGVCSHFGEDQADEPKLVQIRLDKQAPEDLVEPCGHPENRELDLRVTPVSSCSGFEPVETH
ncbi:MAG: hypothetical protein AAF743_00235 [Planctomycetota bacterium]